MPLDVSRRAATASLQAFGVDGESALDISLVYRGSLPACQPGDMKSAEKHELRRKFSSQLAELWAREQLLKKWLDVGGFGRGVLVNQRVDVTPVYDQNPHYEVEVCYYSVLPLITRENGLLCHLDVLLHQRADPGAILTGIADLDNRLKVLFDALRMPLSEKEVPSMGH